MAKEHHIERPSEVVHETEKTPAVPREQKYVGPIPAPLISNLPGDANKYHANELPERHRAFVIATIPEAKWWWK